MREGTGDKDKGTGIKGLPEVFLKEAPRTPEELYCVSRRFVTSFRDVRMFPAPSISEMSLGKRPFHRKASLYYVMKGGKEGYPSKMNWRKGKF